LSMEFCKRFLYWEEETGKETKAKRKEKERAKEGKRDKGKEGKWGLKDLEEKRGEKVNLNYGQRSDW